MEKRRRLNDPQQRDNLAGGTTLFEIREIIAKQVTLELMAEIVQAELTSKYNKHEEDVDLLHARALHRSGNAVCPAKVLYCRMPYFPGGVIFRDIEKPLKEGVLLVPNIVTR